MEIEIPAGTVHVREARVEDEPRLLAIDLATWTTMTSPAPVPAPGAERSFFGPDRPPGDVLVAEVEGAVVGWLRLQAPTPLASSTHVLAVVGLGVDPVVQRRGVGRALIEAAKREVAARDRHRLTLRVLAHNDGARALYARAGFRVEGVLAGEFVLDGRAVDDVLMAWTPPDPALATEPTAGPPLGGQSDHGVDGQVDVPDEVPDPMALVRRWFDDAAAAGERQPEATVLATADVDGRPAARAVLVRGFPDGGLVFHTNRDSRKGRELDANPRAAICSVWHTLHRQVRVEGTVVLAPDDLSEAYWATRPAGSRVSAAASPQSQVIADRDWLEAEVARVADDAGATGPPRPAHWGGYVLVADHVEFWTGRRDRLHDRVAFDRQADGTWTRSLLAP